jgi:hypothetical protein
MNKKLIKDTLGWGFLLWLIGYLLGMLFFMFVPVAFIGWFVTPIGVVITLLVLFRKIGSEKFGYYLKLGAVWAVIAVILDYVFVVMLLSPEDGYYKPDVFLYYILTLALPLFVGWVKTSKKEAQTE